MAIQSGNLIVYILTLYFQQIDWVCMIVIILYNCSLGPYTSWNKYKCTINMISKALLMDLNTVYEPLQTQSDTTLLCSTTPLLTIGFIDSNRLSPECSAGPCRITINNDVEVMCLKTTGKCCC